MCLMIAHNMLDARQHTKQVGAPGTFSLDSKVTLAAFEIPVPNFTFGEILMPSCGKQKGKDSQYFPLLSSKHTMKRTCPTLGQEPALYHLETWSRYVTSSDF